MKKCCVDLSVHDKKSQIIISNEHRFAGTERKNLMKIFQ